MSRDGGPWHTGVGRRPATCGWEGRAGRETYGSPYPGCASIPSLTGIAGPQRRVARNFQAGGTFQFFQSEFNQFECIQFINIFRLRLSDVRQVIELRLSRTTPCGYRGRDVLVGTPAPTGGRWPGAWRKAEAYIYGRRRKVRWKEVLGLWRVAGFDGPVKLVVAEVAGYKKRFTLVGSALELSGVPMVELFAARFRQEDGFRDLN